MKAADLERLAELPVFRTLSGQQIAEIVAPSEAREYWRDDVVFRQDEEGRSFFLLVKGSLRVTRSTPTGQRVVVRYVSPGDLFGIAAALGRTTYPATATAVRHSLVLAWPSSVWPDLANAYPQLQGNLFHAVGDRLDQAQQRVVEMATEDAEHRVAHALLRLAAEQPGAASAESGEVDLQLSRRDVAELSGTTFHTVSRILTAWERQGLVWSRREQIVLRDRSRLSALAGDGDRPPRSPS